MDTIQLVKELRLQTGAPYSDCVKAIKEAEGDIDKAKGILRKLGILKGEGRTKPALEGAIFIKQDTTTALCLLRCETDFVARTDRFQTLGEQIALRAWANPAQPLIDNMIAEAKGALGENIELGATFLTNDRVACYIHHDRKSAAIVAYEGPDPEAARKVAIQCVAMKPTILGKEDLDPHFVSNELTIEMEAARQAGKPEAVAEKIAQGKLQAKLKEIALLEQPLYDDPSTSVQHYVQAHAIEIQWFQVWTV